jgi:hypothetical protein
LAGSVRIAGELKSRNGFEPGAGSRAEAEIREGFLAGKYRPVLEAYHMAELRLVVTADHVGTLAGLLKNAESVYAVSALARTALETSARAAWLLDPRIDGLTRGCRGMTELLYAFREEAKYSIPTFHPLVRKRIGGLVAGAESASIEVFRHRHSNEPLHFGEPRPGATDVIRAFMDSAGELAYRELSAIAHGNPTALLRQTEVVPDHEHPAGVPLPEAERVSLTRPAPSASSVVPLGVVWQAYMQALEQKVELYGWDRTALQAWTTEAGREVVRLLREGESGQQSQ